LILSGRKPLSTRRKMKSKVTKRRKRRWSTYRGLTDRRSSTSTSPLLTKILDVEVEEVVGVVAAVDVVGKVESSAAIGKMASVASAVKDQKEIVHQDRKEMLLPAVEEIVEAVVVVVIAEAEEGGAINKSLASPKRLSQHWDKL